MSTADYLDLFLKPLTSTFTPEFARRLVELRVNEELQSLLNDFSNKANRGMITPEENAQCKALIDAADLLSIL